MADKRNKERDPDAPDLTESDAEAPGPITPEHESGSWEQTLEEQGAQEEREEKAQSAPKPAAKPASKPSGS